jgi:hypothetical protein
MLFGRDLLPIVTDDATDGITDIYLAIDTYTVGAGGATSSEQTYRQIQLAKKLEDVDYVKGLYAKWWGREFSTADFGSGATDLIEKSQDVLNHVCRLQNFDQDKLTPPYTGWGFSYLANYSTVIDNTPTYGGLQYVADSSNQLICSSQINTLAKASTKSLKSTLCKEAWFISATDGEGKEKVYPMEKAFDTSMSRTKITLYNTTDRKITVKDRSSTDIFCTPYVQYNRDEGSGKFLNKITISTPESDTYSAGYVTGVTSATEAQELWNKAESLYSKYLIKNDFPESMAKLYWVKDEASAIIYLNNLLDWMGGTDSGFVDRREISLKLPYEFAKTNGFDIGSLVSIDLPFMSSSLKLNGIINKVNYSLNIKNPICTISAFVELKSIEEGGIILLENGDYLLQENTGKLLLEGA